MKVNKTKDELEFATNWQRVFTDIYQHLKWLNAYAEINEMAMNKILNQFMDVNFENKYNPLRDDLLAYIKERQISCRKELQVALTSILEFFLIHITNGNERAARKILEKQKFEIRRYDALQLTALGSVSVLMTMFALFFVMAPMPNERVVDNIKIKPVTVLFRLNMILSYIIAATGFCIKVFNSYNINYLYIFECDPNYKMTPYSLWRVALILYFIGMMCYTLTLIQVKYFLDTESPFYFMFILFVVLILYCCQPILKCGYRTARF